jgi:DNA-binding transcriptional LysR family regulator
MRITEEGEKLLAAFSAYESELSALLDHISTKKEEVSGSVRIGIFLGFFRREFTQAVGLFLSAYPGVSVKYVYAAPSEFEDLLRAGKLDLALSFTAPSPSSKLQAVPLWEQELALFAAKRHHVRAAELSQLEDQPLIDYYSNPLLFARWAKHHFKRKTAPKNIRAYGASAQAVLDLISEGVGIGIVPKDLAQPLVRAGRISEIAGPRAALTDKIWLLQTSLASEPQRLAILKRYFQESIQPSNGRGLEG